MIGRALDSMIGVFAPRAAVKRMAWRRYASQLRGESSDHKMMQKMLGSRNGGGYEAGKVNRLTTRNKGSAHENDLDRNQIINMRWRSWNLYRNNPQARKIIRSLSAKVIGRSLSPHPQTTGTDGQPFVEFRKRARAIWREFAKEADFRGKPGQGGQHLSQLEKTGLKQVILSGGVLARFKPLTRAEQNRKGLLLPLQIQMIHADRIDKLKHGKKDGGGAIWHGVETNSHGIITHVHILNSGDSTESSRVPREQLVHLFAEEDIDQMLGTPWFCASLLTMDDRRNYEASELTAAEMSSCVVAGYRRSTGQTDFGLGNPDADYELTDGDGNKITSLQPGMFVDLGASGELQMIGGNRPNNNAEGFLNYLIRSEAVGMPGVKSSTLTGDYRQSSFSSERSADNDIWPEIEELQDWFSVGFCQPIYEEVITTAVTIGLFDDVEGFDVSDFRARKREYISANWQGPVARSINPKDDAKAARMRVQNGTSSPQIECAIVGRDWQEILQDNTEFVAYAKELGVEDDYWQQALGIDQTDSNESPEPPSPTEQQQDQATAFTRMSYSQAHHG